ncbi:reverse transcriptase domain-containing protein [Tanacetum coccineum]
MANTTPIVTTVTKTSTKEKAPKETNAAPRVNIQDFCEEHYEDILPVIMDKIRHDKRKEVHTRLDFGDNTKRSRRTRESSQNSSARTWSARHRNPLEEPRVKDRSGGGDGNIFGRLGRRRQSVFDQLSDTYSPSTTKSGPDRTSSRDQSQSKGRPHRQDSPPSRGRSRSKDRSRGVEESYYNTYSFYRMESRHGHRSRDKGRSRIMKRGRTSEPPLSRVSESGTSNEVRWKSASKRQKLIDEEDLAVPWICEEVDPFTPRIRNFKSSRKTRMPYNVKTYDGTGDPEGHVKNFQAAKQVECWAMPTWCHIGILSIFHATKDVKDPVEIHNIKQRDAETLEDFMERFKVETGRMKGAPECMRISGFMHGVNNPELTKRLNEHVPKTMEEMMTVTTAFIRGETAAASKKKGHAPWKPQDQSKRHVSERKSDFRGQSREGRGSNRFTPLTRTPKEILAAEAGKFKPPPPMVTPVEKRSSSKFCDFHNDKGHSTDECMQLKKQIEELVRAGKLSHLIKEIKQGRDQTKNGKKEAPAKDKSLAIYMIQPWHRMTRQKVTQSFARVNEITFPPLTTSKGTEGPLVIEAEIGGHMIHRMLLVTIGDVDHSTKAWMNFMIVRSLSPYNGIIGRPGIREIRAVPSTAHGMLKFPVDGGIVTIRSTILIPAECVTVTTSSKEILKEAEADRILILDDFLVEKPDKAPPDTSVVETPQEPWTLFTNGSSCVDGSGAGLILTSLEGTEFTYALRFQFTASNNEAEYKALIAGLRIAAQMGMHNLHVSVDSKLVANQVLGTYIAKEENMVKYLEKAKNLISGFANFSISQVLRSKNKKADALSKIASASFAHLSKQVLVEVLKEKSIQEKEVAIVVEEEGPKWMTPIVEYLRDGTLPDDKKEASKLRIKA